MKGPQRGTSIVKLIVIFVHLWHLQEYTFPIFYGRTDILFVWLRTPNLPGYHSIIPVLSWNRRKIKRKFLRLILRAKASEIWVLGGWFRPSQQHIHTSCQPPVCYPW